MPTADLSQMTFEETLKKLMKEKDDLEELLAVHYANARYDQQLVDDQGFPRADLNIEEIRLARNRFVCTQNDHKAIMAKIESALHDLHKFKKGPSLPLKFQEPPLEQVYADYKPIVTVTVVDPGSPADLSGLRVGDEVCRVEELTYKNYKSSVQLIEIISLKCDRSVEFIVRRPTETKLLKVHPKRWEGVGILGANFRDYTTAA